MQLNHDWHIHTRRSPCARPDCTIASIAATASAYELVFAGLCDHIDRPEQRTMFTRLLVLNREEAEVCSTRCHLLIGAEVSMIDPHTCALDADTAKECDFVTVACNHYNQPNVQHPAVRVPEAYATHYLAMLHGAADLGFVTTIAHPFFHAKLGLEKGLAVLEKYDWKQIEEVLQHAAAAKMAFELNPSHIRHALPWFRTLVEQAHKAGVKFTIGSDSHMLATIGYRRVGTPERAAWMFRQVGLQSNDILWPESVPKPLDTRKTIHAPVLRYD